MQVSNVVNHNSPKAGKGKRSKKKIICKNYLVSEIVGLKPEDVDLKPFWFAGLNELVI